MMIVVIVIVLMMRLGPIAIDKHVAAIALFPTWRYPDRSAMGWKFPMPANPLMSSTAVRPVSFHPHMVAGGTIPFDNHFVARCRWRSEVNVYVDRCDQTRCDQRRAAGGERREGTHRDQHGQAIVKNGFSRFYVRRYGHDAFFDLQE